MMKKLIALAAAVLGLSVLLVAPAEARTPTTFVNILTTRVSALGDVYVDDLTGETVVLRPTFKTDMNVRCPAGKAAAITISPVPGMTNTGVSFTCTGLPQVVTFPSTAATPEFGWHYTNVSARLWWLGDPTTPATDSQQVYVYTSRKDLYPGN
jgi:hypothetical protein